MKKPGTTTLLILFVTGSLLFFPVRVTGFVDNLSDPGNPAVKTDWKLGLREFPSNFFDYDTASYLVQTQTIHGTEVVVAIHNSLVGIADIQGFAVPTAQEFANFVFQVFHRHWHVFNGFLYSRYTVKVNAMSDPQTFRSASEVGLVLGSTGASAIPNFPPHHYVRVMFEEFVSHEMFHAWNGRIFSYVSSGDGRLFQLETWIQEGSTVYYSAWVRGIVLNIPAYTGALQSRWNQYIGMVGTEFDLSIEELTFQIGTPTTIPPPSGKYTDMLYARSSLINYMLDVELAKLGVSLDSLMRHLYENYGLAGKAWEQADIAGILQSKSGRNFLDFFAAYLRTNAILPVDGNFLFVNHPESAFNQPGPASLLAAVLPSSRSAQMGIPATAFATIINAGAATATGCGIFPMTSLPFAFTFQATDPATNQPTEVPNALVDIAAGAARSFIISLTPTASIAPTDVQFSFSCNNSNPATIISGVNTLLFSASATPVPDIVALGATLNNDGIVNIPGTTGTGVFAVATVNVGATGNITATADTGEVSLPVNLSLCQTNPTTGVCLAPPSNSVTTMINANATPTFGIFVQGTSNVAFNPATNRIFVRFKDGGNVTRGATSVAVRTQ